MNKHKQNNAIDLLVDNNLVIWLLIAGGAASYIAGVGFYLVLPKTFINGVAIGWAVSGGVAMAVMALSLWLLGPTLEERVMNAE